MLLRPCTLFVLQTSQIGFFIRLVSSFQIWHRQHYLPWPYRIYYISVRHNSKVHIVKYYTAQVCIAQGFTVPHTNYLCLISQMFSWSWLIVKCLNVVSATTAKMILSTSRSEIKNINLIEFERMEELTGIILRSQIFIITGILIDFDTPRVCGWSTNSFGNITKLKIQGITTVTCIKIHWKWKIKIFLDKKLRF